MRVAVFPLLIDLVREADVQRCVDGCVAAGLIRLYTVVGKPYLEVTKWQQRLRAKTSRWPAPAGHCHDIDVTMPTETEAHTDTETETEAAPRKTTAEGPDPADTLGRLTGIGQAMNPEVRGLVRDLISIDGMDHARNALDRAIAKKGATKKAVQYAMGIVRGEKSENGAKNGTPVISLKDRPKSTKYAS